MAVKQEVVLEFNADTSDVQKSLAGLDKDFDKVGKSANDAAEEVEGLADATEDAAKGTKDLGENSKKAGSDMKKAGKTGATGFKLVGTAIKATGIGLLVGLMAKLIGKFTENKKVAEALEVAFAGLGVVLNLIVDALTPLADFLFKAFTEPQEAVETLRGGLTALGDYFKTLLSTAFNPVQRGLLNLKRGFLEAAASTKEFFGGDATELKQSIAEVDDQLADLVKQQEENKETLKAPFVAAQEALSEYVDKTKEGIAASTELTKKQQALRDAQRELNVATAEGAAEVEELKRQSDDQRLSTEERIEAATRAAEINQRFADENVAISQQRAQLLREEIALQGETAERLDELASAEIEAANAAQASSTIQTELQNKLFALNQETLAQQQEAIDKAKEEKDEKIAALQEFYDQAQQTIADGEEKTRATELAATAKKYKEQLALAEELGDDTSALLEAQRVEELGINEKYDDLTAQSSQRAQQAKLDVAKQTLGALSALQQAFASEDQARAEKNFKIQKALSLAQATIAGVEGVQNAFTTASKSPITALFPAYPFIQAGLAGAFSVAQIATIAKSSFSSPAPPSPDTSGGGGGGGVGASAATAATAPAAPQLDLGFLGGGAEQTGPIQAFVLSENVSNAQQANQLIEDQATL